MKEIRVEDGPIVVQGGSEDYVYRNQLSIPVHGYVTGVWVFHGLDRGNIVEMDTEVFDPKDNVSLVLRSPHKEWIGEFDAWQFYPVDGYYAEELKANLACRVTGHTLYIIDSFLKFLGRGPLSARPHWGIRVQYVPADEVDIPLPPLPDPEPALTDYIPVDQIEDWSKKLRNAWDPWDQWRDLEALLVRGRNYWEVPFDVTEAELKALVAEGYELNAEEIKLQDELEKAVRNRRCSADDPEWCKRLNLRKSRVLNFTDRCKIQQGKHNTLRSRLEGQPGEGVEWDSIKGWLERKLDGSI